MVLGKIKPTRIYPDHSRFQLLPYILTVRFVERKKTSFIRALYGRDDNYDLAWSMQNIRSVSMIIWSAIIELLIDRGSMINYDLD